MRYSQSEKMEIVRLVEESDLAITRTLEEWDVPKSTLTNEFIQY
jgi:transposase-like protein